MPDQALLAVSLGPVQRFIVQARRTQDLWAGSLLLAELSRFGARWLVERGARLLLPDPALLEQSDEAAVASMPNRFVVALPLTVAAQQAADMEAAVRAHWRDDIAEPVRHALTRLTDDPDHWADLWRQQIDTHLELHWALAPWDGSDAGYRAAWTEVQRRLAGRKALRDFAPRPGSGELDTITGEDACLPGGADRRAARAFWAALAEAFQAQHRWPTALRAGGTERLSAVSAVKRLQAWARHQGPSGQRFPSTSSIAAAAWLADTAKTAADPLARALSRYQQRLIALGLARTGALNQIPALQRVAHGLGPFGDWDGDVLYATTLAEGRLRRDYGLAQVDRAALHDALQARRQVVKVAGTEPPSYYAVVAFDGDQMGRWVSGDGDFVDADSFGPAYHTKLSQGLSAFADQARAIVEQEHRGRLIYAGGDDVLAVLPLVDAVGCADWLATAFGAAMSDSLGALKRQPATATATASAGVVVVHHNHPLEVALTHARQAEQAAKHTYGRAAVAVRIVRRSGETTEVGGRWDSGRLAERVNDLVRRLRADTLPRGFVKALANEAPAMALVAPGGQAARLAWLIEHHAGKPTAQALVEPLKAWAQTLAEQPEPNRGGLARLSDWVDTAEFLARGHDQGDDQG